MESQLIPVTAPQPAAQNPLAAFAQPSPYLTLGDMLSGFGQGLLSQGPSPVPLSPFAGLAAGIGGAQQGIQLAQQQQQMRQQNILNRQQYQKGQQDLTAGNLTNASSLLMLNLRRQRWGLPPVTSDDVANNPSLSAGDPAMMGAPPAQSATAQGAAPSGAATSTAPFVTSAGQPATAGNMQVTPAGNGSYSTNVSPNTADPSTGAQPAGGNSSSTAAQPGTFQSVVSGIQSGSDIPAALQQAEQDAWYDPKLSRAEIEAIKATPQYQEYLSQWTAGRVLGSDGQWHNMPGSVQSSAEMAGANAGSTAQAQVGPHNQEKAFSASVTPTTINVPVYGADGKSVIGYQQVNTSQLAAATSPTPGLPVVDPTNPQQIAQLAAAGQSGKGSVTPYTFAVKIPDGKGGFTYQDINTNQTAAATGNIPGVTQPTPDTAFPQGSRAGSYGQPAAVAPAPPSFAPGMTMGLPKVDPTNAQQLAGIAGAVTGAQAKARGEYIPYVMTIQGPNGTQQDINTNRTAAAAAGPQGANPAGVPGEKIFTPEQASNQQDLAKYRSNLTNAANDAQADNVRLVQMLDTMRGFTPNSSAPYVAQFRGWLNAAGLSTAEQDKALSSYQEFGKVTVQHATQMARQMGAREAASVVEMFVNANPNAKMTPTAITGMVNAMKAQNEYIIAKNQAAQQFYNQNGTLNGFDANWQQQNPPIKFLAPYLDKDQLAGPLGQMAKPFLPKQPVPGTPQFQDSIQQKYGLTPRASQ